MISSVGQYLCTVAQNEKTVMSQPLDHPFIVSTVSVKGFRAALRVLFGGIQIVTRVQGSPAALKVVLSGDYTPAEKEPAQKGST